MIHFLLAHQTVNRHNRALIALVGILGLLLATISAMKITTDSYLNQLLVSKTKIYGAFTDIIYQTGSQISDQPGLQQSDWGVILSQTIQTDDDLPLVIGTMNELGQTLAFQAPESASVEALPDGHCVMTASVARKYFNNASVGSSIQLDGNTTLVIDHVIDDYSLL